MQKLHSPYKILKSQQLLKLRFSTCGLWPLHKPLSPKTCILQFMNSNKISYEVAVKVVLWKVKDTLC